MKAPTRSLSQAILLCLASLPLAGRATAVACPDDKLACGPECAPLGSSCCDDQGHFCTKGFKCGARGCLPEGSVECGQGSGVYCPKGNFCPDRRSQSARPTRVAAGFAGVRFGESALELERSFPGGVTGTGHDNAKRPTTTYQVRHGWADFADLIVQFHFLSSELRSVSIELPRGMGSMPETERAMQRALAKLTTQYGPPDATSEIGGAYWGFTNSVVILERQTSTPGVVVPRVTFNAAIAGVGPCIPNYYLLRSPELRRLNERPSTVDDAAGAPDGGLTPAQGAWPCLLATSNGDDLLPDTSPGHPFASGTPLSKVKQTYPGGSSASSSYEVRLANIAGYAGLARFSFDKKLGLREVLLSFWRATEPGSPARSPGGAAEQASLHEALQCVLTKKLGAPTDQAAEHWTDRGGGSASLREPTDASTWRVRFEP